MTAAAVIVVNFASSALLDRNLSRLTPSEDVRIVVVDCYSSSAERARVQALGLKNGWNIVPLDRNVGFGAGVNAGAERALSEDDVDVLIPLNPDAVIEENALAILVEKARSHPGTLFSPRILDSDDRVWFAGADLYLDDGSTAGTFRRPERTGRPRREWATGACFAISAELWRRVEGFDDDYFLYWEDIDLSHRILDAGGRLELLDVVVIHDEGQTHLDGGSSRAKSETYYFYNIRNRLLYAAKHLDDRGWRRWLSFAPVSSYRIILQGGRRQLVTSFAPWRAYFRGLLHGQRIARTTRSSAKGGSESNVRPMRVMQSFKPPRPTTNPYITMLDHALAAERSIEHVRFSWRDALTTRIDVMHLHWPEVLLEGDKPWKRWGKRQLLRALLLKLRVTNAALVRTAHNVELPQDVDDATRKLLVAIEERADHRIVLNTSMDTGDPARWTHIPHGHYRDWFEPFPRAERVARRIGYFGLIRRYKGVETLLETYEAARTDDDTLSLRIGGKPSSPELAAVIEDAASRVPDITTTLRFLHDAELVDIASSSQVIVLPYRFMHNSGGALAALSIDRPVLVPRNEVNAALADEVGQEWVLLYDGALTPERLRAAVLETVSLQGHPDLSRREWDDVGRAHSAVFGKALAARGRR